MTDIQYALHEDVIKTVTKISDMIFWLAKRTLTAKEFIEFVDAFVDKSKLKACDKGDKNGE